MKKILIYISSIVLLLAISTSCEDYLEVTPKTIIVDEQLWSSDDLIVSHLANLYNRIPVYASIYGSEDPLATTDDLMYTGLWNNLNEFSTYGYGYQNIYDYGYIRHLNDFIEKATAATEINEANKKLYIAEGRFLRAYTYFEMVKRMGGVPLITSTYVYDDFLQDPEAVQIPRSKESDIYDFIASEVDAIKEDLSLNGSSQTRATKWTALALKARAMLYAGSLAKYNSMMATPITLPGGEVGIPAGMSDGYYQKAQEAAVEIINNGPFQLMNSASKADNFYSIINNKSGNTEVIFAKDFTTGKTHNFTNFNIARSLREDASEASHLSPTLGLVESYEYQTDFDGTLQTKDSEGNYILYADMIDLFEGKDPRLFGTVLVPGSTFKGQDVDILAGVAIWDGTEGSLTDDNFTYYSGSGIGTVWDDGGPLVGSNGPLGLEIHTANSGFSMRKFISDKPGDGIRSQGNQVWWPYFRYGEILLIAGEAAYERGASHMDEALGYINQVRDRAGIQPLDASTISIERIQNERRVELAFEGLRWWDLKRFRIAHVLFDGTRSTDGTFTTAEHGALWPYRVIAPGNPDMHNKYIFVKKKAPRQVDFARFFRLGNYYGEFSDALISANPSLVKNPNQ
ncbi:MAG TPA: RagB/SusD family nutrient uptake outer membrane protein [Draconibacterium sp.]|nr:RagB/SusD family nutrient uptake outer membrane protein [Draconibacterium sp.]